MNTHALSPSFLTLILLFITVNLTAQLKNGSFEIATDSLPEHPQSWHFTNSELANFSLSTETKATGEKSFYADLSNNTSGQNHYFSQVVPFKGENLQRVLLSFYMKSDLEGAAGVWWQVRDKDNNQIGFTNSGLQGLTVHGQTVWTKHSLLLTINENCNRFIIGGYFSGKGHVWFDDFKLEGVDLPETPPSKEVKKYNKAFKSIVKKHSLYGDSLDWKQIDKDLSHLSRGINSMDHVAAPKDYLLKKLREAGDNHSFIASKASFETSLKTQTSTSVPYSKLLENEIGYINVPDFSSRNDSVNIAFATKIQDLIKELDTGHDIKSWVVDLRDNPGGNMHPMLAGLGPLTGEGRSGNFVTGKDKKSTAWFYKAGGFGVGKNVTTQVETPYQLKQSHPKIAVLIGSRTGSSGEMTAVAFIGKENTKLFGQTSAGYTTTNQDFALPNGARVYLASGYVSDRNNTVYLKNLKPDIPVIEDTKNQDKTLEAAINWLRE